MIKSVEASHSLTASLAPLRQDLGRLPDYYCSFWQGDLVANSPNGQTIGLGHSSAQEQAASLHMSPLGSSHPAVSRSSVPHSSCSLQCQHTLHGINIKLTQARSSRLRFSQVWPTTHVYSCVHCSSIACTYLQVVPEEQVADWIMLRFNVLLEPSACVITLHFA